MTATLELPRISIQNDVKKAEARPFVARVTNDSIQPSKFDVDKKPFQWTIAVSPLKSADGSRGWTVKGKTGSLWEYVSISVDDLAGEIKSHSKFGRHFNAFKEVFGTEEDRAIGRGEYVNEVAWFVRDSVEYGTNKETGEAIKSTVLLPVRPLTDEELVEYGLLAGSEIAVSTTYTDEELTKLATALDGKDRNALQKAAYAAKLGNKLAQGVAKGNGPAIDALVEGGFGSFDGDVFRAS